MIGSPNGLAYLVLLGWLPVCVALFATVRPATAGALSLVGAALLLPSNFGIDVPVLTAIDKEIMPPLFALLGCAIFQPDRLRRARPARGAEALVLVMIVGVFGTAATNGDGLQYGPIVLPGESAYDAFVSAIDLVLRYGVPFLLGRALIVSTRDLQEVFVVIGIGALLYTLPALFEMRMAPHLNDWIYGYQQSDFSQTVRGGGFRPKVFMRHGLNLTLYFAFSVIALRGLARAGKGIYGLPSTPLFAYVAIVLALCRSVAAVLYSVAGVGLLFVRSRSVMRMTAIGLAVVTFSYPLLRAIDVIPADAIIQLTGEELGGEKEQSVRARFENEAILLEKARSRLIFGWGGYGRGRMYDVETGKDLSVTDGFWALTVSQWGLWGYTCIFGMLLLPVVRAGSALPRIQSARTRGLVWTLTVICAVYVLDLIPNAGISAYVTFLAGGLAGIVPAVLRDERRSRWKAGAKADSSRGEDRAGAVA